MSDTHKFKAGDKIHPVGNSNETYLVESIKTDSYIIARHSVWYILRFKQENIFQKHKGDDFEKQLKEVINEN